jgi:hypothetical protein
MLKLLLAPIFLHVILTTIVGISTLRGRYDAVRSGKTKLRDIAVDASAWPEEVRKLGNNFDNQFQVPMVWYGCSALLVSTGLYDGISVALSWSFLATRLLHSYVHAGTNHIPLRMRVFLAGYTLVILMWLWFAARLFVTG